MANLFDDIADKVSKIVDSLDSSDDKKKKSEVKSKKEKKKESSKKKTSKKDAKEDGEKEKDKKDKKEKDNKDKSSDSKDSDKDKDSKETVIAKKDRTKWEETVKKYDVPKDIVERQKRYLDKLEFLVEDAAKRAEFFKDFQMPGVSYVADNEEGITEGSDDGEGGEYDFDYETGWLGTIYAPTLGGINSSGDPTVTATGVKVKNFRTIAVDPAVIPYGSFVAIKADGVEKLTRIWHAEDTGGAINGKHIDMCVDGNYAKNHSFKGDISVAIVKKGKNAQTARDNEKKGIDDIIAEIESSATKKSGGSTSVKAKGVYKKACQAAIKKSKETTHYSQERRTQWEKNTFDCSSFCNWAYQEAGVYIMGKSNGRNGYTQTIKTSKKMKTIEEKDLKPGDFVFMSSYGHVGIYIGDNKWVGCGLRTKVHINEMGEPWYDWNCTHRRWKG